MKITNEHLAIGIPCSFPYIAPKFLYSFLEMERPDFTLVTGDNGPIDTLRNDIVEKAQAAGATKLIMLDVDMVYHPLTITRLMAHNLPIVGALCWRRYPPFDSIMLRLSGEGYNPVEEWEDGELVEVDATGAGCIMYDMEVFRTLEYPWFRFQKNPDNGMIIGEDIGLCQDAKAAGYRIFVDTSVPAGHMTTLIVNEATFRLYQQMKTHKEKTHIRQALQGG